MAGFVVHLAVAEEYIRKHGNIKNHDEFTFGAIMPDLYENKKASHYGIKTSKPNLKKYLNENKLDSELSKGYLLHLITDYLFYNHYLEFFSKDIYNDYDITNSELINEYNIVIPSIIKSQIFFKEGNTKVMSIDLAKRVINEVSDLELDKVVNEIYSDELKWKKFKTLEKR